MKKGTIINNTYYIVDTIGMGALGEIYLGYHNNLQKYVVIKKVKSHCTGLINNRIEVDILKSLHHSYLPQVYDFIENEDGIFTVMEYISGHDLKYYIEAGYHFEEEQLIFWMKQLCEVLEYLHNRKPSIIHCDIKPGNIMITEEGNICLIDFNISLDGENNKDLVGLSSAYASPEQIKKAEHKMRYGSGEAVKMDERTDIYSVGTVFYYLMSGIRSDIRSGQTFLLKEMKLPYSSSLCNIVDKAMSFDVSKRFRSALKMREALDNKEKWETQHLRSWKRGIIIGSVFVCISLIIGCTFIVREQLKKTETFRQDCRSYAEIVQEWNTEIKNNSGISDTSGIEGAKEVISMGAQLLNQTKYIDMFEKYPEQKAEILCRIGQGLMYLENYEQAEEYFEEAVEYQPDSPEIYRDLSITQARQGYIRSAEETLEMAMDEGLDREECMLLYAELALAEGNYEEVWEYASSVIENQNEKVATRAAAYLLEAAQKLENTDELLTLFDTLKEQSQGAMRYVWIRKQAETYSAAYEEGNGEALKSAVGCYEEIYQNGYAQLNDLYNLAACYQEQGKLQQAEKILKEMLAEYPEEYKVSMRLAYIIYWMQSDKSAKLRDYQMVREYFQNACKICERTGENWRDDVNMVQLEDIIFQLTKQGWLG